MKDEVQPVLAAAGLRAMNVASEAVTEVEAAPPETVLAELEPLHAILKAKFHVEDGSSISITTAEGDSVMPTGQALLNADLATWIRQGNEIAPYYTITGAVFSNDEGTAVMAQTVEAGRVLVTQAKRGRWAALQKWVATGGVIAPYVPDPAAEAGARKAKLAASMLDAIVDDANAGKSLDEIRVELKAVTEAAGRRRPLRQATR